MNKKVELILERHATKEMMNLYKSGELFINQQQLACIIGKQTRTAIIHLNKFNKKVKEGFYPKESFINPDKKNYIVWIKPLMHFYLFKHYYNTKNEKNIPKFTRNFFDEVM